MLTKQDIEDYKQVSEQPKAKEKNLRDYLRNLDKFYKQEQQNKINYEALIKPWLDTMIKPK